MAQRADDGKFLKGHKGFSPGRPKKENTIKHWLQKLGEEIYNDGKNEATRFELLALMLWRKAIVDQDATSAREIIDRIDGKATQTNVNHNIQVPDVIEIAPGPGVTKSGGAAEISIHDESSSSKKTVSDNNE